MVDDSAKSGGLGVAAAVAAVIGAAGGDGPLSAVAGLYEVVEQAGAFLRQRQGLIVRRLLEDAFFTNSSDSGAFYEFRAMLGGSDPKANITKSVFLQTVRAAEASVDEAVYPALAMLMRQYVREARQYDAFFRSCSRLLQELSAEEFGSYAALMTGIGRSALEDRLTVHARIVVAMPQHKLAEGAPISGEYLLVTPTIEGRPGRDASFAVLRCDPSHAERLFHLIDREHLGRRSFSSMNADTRHATAHLDVHVGTARRVAAVLP